MNTSQGTIQYLIAYVIDLINRDLVPLVFAIAFAMFLFGVFRFYFLKGTDPKAREEGKGFIIWSVVAFAVMLSVWGLVNIVRGTVPFLNNNQPGLPTFNPSGSAAQPTVQGVPATIPGTPATVSGSPAPAPSAAGGGPGDTCANGNCGDVNGIF